MTRAYLPDAASAHTGHRVPVPLASIQGRIGARTCLTDALFGDDCRPDSRPGRAPGSASTTAPMNLGIDVRLYGYGTAWPRGGVT